MFSGATSQQISPSLREELSDPIGPRKKRHRPEVRHPCWGPTTQPTCRGHDRQSQTTSTACHRDVTAGIHSARPGLKRPGPCCIHWHDITCNGSGGDHHKRASGGIQATAGIPVHDPQGRWCTSTRSLQGASPVPPPRRSKQNPRQIRQSKPARMGVSGAGWPHTRAGDIDGESGISTKSEAGSTRR